MHRSYLLLLMAVTLAAQTRDPGPLPRYEVKRASTAIRVDGKLDDAAWKAVYAATLKFPWDQQKCAKQKTTARML